MFRTSPQRVRRSVLAAVAGVATGFLAGCALPGSIGPDDTIAPPSDVTGTVWVYRVAPRATPGVWQDVFIDGRVRAEARPGATRRRLSVGPHVVDIMTNKLRIDVPKDGRVFVRIEVDERLFGTGIYPVLVDETTARREISALGINIDAP